jgi:hypothetical protein
MGHLNKHHCLVNEFVERTGQPLGYLPARAKR